MSIYVLCIGCNYKGQSAELAGCVNDAYIMGQTCELRLKTRIHTKFIMTDDRSPSAQAYPSKANIIRQLNAIVQLATASQINGIVMHFSGHGSFARDANKDERDGRDETIVPTDYQTAGEISDDWFQTHFLNRLPPRVQFFALIDACHSGTFADQHFSFQPSGRVGLRAAVENRKARINCRHVVISGCTDNSYSYDGSDQEFGPSGACTAAFVRALRQTRRLDQIIRLMRQRLGRQQVPQLSASMPVTGATNILML